MRRDVQRPEDDGHTVADMSGIERQNLFLPRFKPRKPVAYEPPQEERPWEEIQLTPEERRMQIFIALKAALLIALVFLVGLGAVILLLLWLWT